MGGGRAGGLFRKRKILWRDKLRKQFLNWTNTFIDLLIYHQNTNNIFSKNLLHLFWIIPARSGVLAKRTQLRECIYLFAKKLLGVKKSTQNDFIYGGFGRISYQTKRYFIIIKYWFKILSAQNNKYIKMVYELMLRDIELLPRKVNWVSTVRHLLMTLDFYAVWLGQGMGNNDGFMSALKQRLTDNFVQNWRSRLEDSSRAVFYRSVASFHFQPYLEHNNVYKFSQALSKLRVSSHRLEIEAGRWVTPHSIPVKDRKCVVCQVLEDEWTWRLMCVGLGMFTVCRRLRMNHLPLIVWILVLLKKLLAEMYVHRAL